MFRWRSTLSQWGIISETEEENQGNRRKTDETGRGDAQIIYLLIKIFLRYGQVLFRLGYTKKSCDAQGSSKYYLFVTAPLLIVDHFYFDIFIMSSMVLSFNKLSHASLRSTKIESIACSTLESLMASLPSSPLCQVTWI